MIKITYQNSKGVGQCVEVEEGMSLMDGAVLNLIDGIEGICGGISSCGTCHVLIPDAWQNQLEAPGLSERLRLDQLEGREARSRLACQIIATDSCDGMVVTVVNA